MSRYERIDKETSIVRPAPSNSVVVEMSPLAKRVESAGDSDHEDGPGETARLRRPLPTTGSGLAAEIVAELIGKIQPVDQRELAEMSRARFAASQCASIFISVMAVVAVIAFSVFNNGALLNLAVELVNATLLASEHNNNNKHTLSAAAAEDDDNFNNNDTTGAVFP